MATNVTNEAEVNVITTDEMARVREIDFVNRFSSFSLTKLLQMLGVTRQIPMQEGTTMYVYKTVGTLASGVVPEGEIIPLSQYERTKTAVGEIGLKKWRKATTAEAIMKSGADEAIRQTDDGLLVDVQKGIRTDFFTFINGLSNPTEVEGDTLQAILAQAWGELQVLFENDAVEAVYFLNPLTVADYLGTANITVQTAFGLNYVEDFLGLGTVILTSQVAKDDIVATAKENLIMYFLTMNGDVATSFNLTTDETGYIGIHQSQTDNRAQIETLVMSGIQFLVEYEAGVVKGTIESGE